MDNTASLNNPINTSTNKNIDSKSVDILTDEKLLKFKRILRMTLTNTINMNNRLKKRELFSNSVLIYYSIFLIIYSITGKYFPSYFNGSLAEYFNLILSIVLLVFSLVNINANYSNRIHNSNDIIHRLRNIRRSIDLNNYEIKENEYKSIIKDIEGRTNSDFFKTLKSECRQNGTNWIALTLLRTNTCTNSDVSKLREHLCEIHPFWEQFKLIVEGLLYIVLLLTPVLVFILCFSVKIAQ